MKLLGGILALLAFSVLSALGLYASSSGWPTVGVATIVAVSVALLLVCLWFGVSAWRKRSSLGWRVGIAVAVPIASALAWLLGMNAAMALVALLGVHA